MTAIHPLLRFRPHLQAAAAGLTLLIVATQPCAAPAGKAAAPARAPDANCGLAAPPPDAGVDRHMGALLRIHPRNPDIGPDYAGCQTLWAEDGDDWAVVTVAHYRAGHVVRVESPLAPRDPVNRCRIEHGVVAQGDPELCASIDEMRFESAPSSCLAVENDKGPACRRL